MSPRWDVERAYPAQQPGAGFNALNMRARIAALRTTYRRINELIEEYGVETFFAAQEGIIDYVERVVRRRLSEMPDGSWYAMGYHDHDGNENKMYPICCRVIKQGDELTFDMTGTAEQAVGVDQLCAAGDGGRGDGGDPHLSVLRPARGRSRGLRNLTTIISEPGTLNNALSPARREHGIDHRHALDAGCGGPGLRQDAAELRALSRGSAGKLGPPGTTTCSSPRRLAESPSSPWSPTPSAAVGARGTFADGIDSGGIFHSMASRVSNVETLESRGSILQVYRRQLADAGGPGRYRGGVPIEFATIPHKLRTPLGAGEHARVGRLPAGRPGAVRRLAGCGRLSRHPPRNGHRATAVRRQVPVAPEGISSARVDVQEPKALAPDLSPGDLLIGVLAGGAGFGDPLRRDPQATVGDVDKGLVSEACAESVYGVVIRGG